MADFMQIMKDWRRMCRSMDFPDHTIDTIYGSDKCDNCSIGDERMCVHDVSEISDEEFQNIADKVSAWAMVNPEPLTPTWGEWFIDHGLLQQGWENPTNPDWYKATLTKLMNTSIPIDIAEKLGVLNPHGMVIKPIGRKMFRGTKQKEDEPVDTRSDSSL